MAGAGEGAVVDVAFPTDVLQVRRVLESLNGFVIFIQEMDFDGFHSQAFAGGADAYGFAGGASGVVLASRLTFWT